MYKFKKYLFIFILLSVELIFSQIESRDIYDLDLEELVKIEITSASKSKENISELSPTIRIITEAEIIEKGYFTLTEVLSELPGFQIRDILGFNSYAFLRGIPNQNNLILLLIDGIQINELNSGGFYCGGQYNLNNVERIEIIYGPNSVVYGTNAISGIINIVTKNYSNHFNFNSKIGNFETFSNDFSYSFLDKDNDFRFRLSGMYKKTDKADLKGAEGDNNWTDLMDNYEDNYSLDFKAKYKHFTFGTNFIQKKSSMATYIKSVGTNYKDYGTQWNIRFINSYLKFDYNLLKNLTLNSILYLRLADVLDNTIVYVLDTAQVGYYRPNNLLGFENVLKYSLNDKISVTGGLLFENENLSERYSVTYSKSQYLNPPTPSKPKLLNNSLVSLFLEPRITLLDNIIISPGFRYDYSSAYKQVLTPNIGIIYNFSRHLLRLNYSEAFRAPKPWDYTDGIGNPSLHPEKIKSIEAGIEVLPWKNFVFRLNAYKNDFYDAIMREFLNGKYRWINSGKIITRGLEASLNWFVNNFKTSINYTYTDSKDENEKPVPEISKHLANFSFTYSFTDKIKLNLRANYVGERENPKLIQSINSKFIDSYLIFHSTLSLIDYEGFTVQFIVKNLFNKEYYHTSNREPDRYRQPQRTFLISIGYSFNY